MSQIEYASSKFKSIYGERRVMRKKGECRDGSDAGLRGLKKGDFLKVRRHVYKVLKLKNSLQENCTVALCECVSHPDLIGIYTMEHGNRHSVYIASPNSVWVKNTNGKPIFAKKLGIHNRWKFIEAL